ncbi:hypothetical protein ACFYWN_29810 [Streptomyces sp. NPDC002917]|uniref:hypothetical protein n=1 Tax=Streptomyces sp. NPDC002917 TaxID=3364671 RepID=UPI0036A92FA7
MSAIDTMIDEGQAVGPLLCCAAHRLLFIPVVSGTADLWGAAHSACSNGRRWQCLAHEEYQPCRERFWVAPPQPWSSSTTPHVVLHHTLSLTRARMRSTATQPFRTRALKVCDLVTQTGFSDITDHAKPLLRPGLASLDDASKFAGPWVRNAPAVGPAAAGN